MKRKTKPINAVELLGIVFDARVEKPPAMKRVLVFVDELYDWVGAMYDGKAFLTPTIGESRALYWTHFPPASLSELRRLARRRIKLRASCSTSAQARCL